MENIFGGGGSREGLRFDVMLMDLIKENLRRVGIVDGLHLIR